jgi:GT2 family glycosyltransferase
VDHLIFVDDCSPVAYSLPDGTIRQKMDKNSGPAAARNKGIQTALDLNSDIIAFTDVDCILAKDWVQAIVDAYQRNPNFHILSGNTLSFDSGWLGKYHEINGTLNGRKFIGLDRLLYGVTANLAITATVAKKVRFNEAFRKPACEDVEFCFRANEESFGIRQVPEMIVKHNYGYNSHAFRNLKGFMKLFKKYGKAEKLLLENIPDLYNFFDNTEEISILSSKSSHIQS